MTNNKSNKLSLLNKYQSLLIENDKLKAENKKLRTQLEVFNFFPNSITEMPVAVAENDKVEISLENPLGILTKTKSISVISQNSKPAEKIRLFMSLFKGREDIYAKRWQTKNGKSGYAKVCFNEWKPVVCNKPKIKCSECSNKAFEPLNEKVIEEHLRGNIIA